MARLSLTALALIVWLVIFAGTCSAAPPEALMVSPQDSYVSPVNYTGITCNATDDEAVSELTLYADTGDSWERLKRVLYGELQPGLGHTMLCHMQNYSCYNSGGGSAGTLTQSGASLEPGKTGEAARVGSGDSLSFSTTGRMSSYVGTVEFWVRPRASISGTAWLFMMGESHGDKSNQVRLFINSTGQLVFEWYDDYGSRSFTYQDISWSSDEWHHVAAVWDYDNSNMDLMVDGSNATTANPYMGGAYYPSWTPSTAYIGSDYQANDQLDAAFDELIVFTSAVARDEIQGHYESGLGAPGYLSRTWNITGLADGEYLWTCYAVDNQSNSTWNNTNRTFFIDSGTPPGIAGVERSPQGNDLLDPGIDVNVTANITDPSGVHTAILQYRRESVSTWSNVTMGNLSGQYNASFGVPAPDGMWYYRIWANDTMGHSGNSSEYSLTVDYDYTWSVNPQGLGTTYVYINEEGALGVLTITNTGDYPLSFGITSTYTNTEYNLSNPDSFDVAAGSNLSIMVNATATSQAYEYAVNLTIGAASENAEPAERVANATLISYVGGPYLELEITRAPTSVSQSDTGVNVSARVKNIGNETATGVRLNFSLPSGFSNTSGNASHFVGSLSQGASYTSTLSLSIDPASAGAGAVALMVNSSCSEGSNASDSAVIGVSCSSTDGVCGLGCSSSTDSDCQDGGGGSSAGTTVISGGGAPVTENALSLSAPQRLELERGSNHSFSVNIEYGLSFTSDSLSLEVSGYPLTYVTVSPEERNGVNQGDTVRFIVTLEAPGYISQGQYNLSMELSGGGRTLNRTLSGSHSMTVSVVSTGEESDLLDRARELSAEMQEAGYSAENMNASIERMDALAGEWDYEAAREIAEQVIEKAELAFRVEGMMAGLEGDISSAKENGIEAPESESLLRLAEMAFQRGDYQRAEERALSARASFSLETYGLLWVLSGIRENWVFLGMGAAGLAAALLLGRRYTATRLLRARISSLRLEERGLERMIVNLQKAYFSARPRVGKDTYSRAVQDYEARLADIKRAKARLISGGGSVRKTLKSLRREREEISRFMKDTQRRYFSGDGVGRGLYEAIMKRMRQETAEIDKSMDMLRKRKGSLGLGIAAVALAGIVLMSGLVAAQDVQATLEQEIREAELVIADMAGSGFKTSHVSDVLNEARLMQARGEESAALALARQVGVIFNAAREADMLIDHAEQEILGAGEEGLDVLEAREALEEGISLFGSESYIEAEQRLGEALELVEEARAEAAMERGLSSSPLEQASRAATENWAYLLAAALALPPAWLGLRRLRSGARLRKKLRELESERGSIKELMSHAQKRYFSIGSLGRADYEAVMDRHRSRLVRVEKAIYMMRQGVRI